MHSNLECYVHELGQIGSGQMGDGKSEHRHFRTVPKSCLFIGGQSLVLVREGLSNSLPAVLVSICSSFSLGRKCPVLDDKLHRHPASLMAQMVKNLPAILGLIPGSGRSSVEGNGYPLQYSCLENLMDREAWEL